MLSIHKLKFQEPFELRPQPVVKSGFGCKVNTGRIGLTQGALESAPPAETEGGSLLKLLFPGENWLN